MNQPLNVILVHASRLSASNCKDSLLLYPNSHSTLISTKPHKLVLTGPYQSVVLMEFKFMHFDLTTECTCGKQDQKNHEVAVLI